MKLAFDVESGTHSSKHSVKIERSRKLYPVLTSFHSLEFNEKLPYR